MNLMSLIRLAVIVLIGWTGLALGARVFGVGAQPTNSPSYYLPRPSLHDAVVSARGSAPGFEEFHLVDQTTGRIDPFPMPDGDRWGLFSVSPWRDREGHLQAVGRWVVKADGEEGNAFCGLGLLRLPDATVKSRITLNVLPTGRPCWIPGRPGEVIFPAGDGRLHRCRIDGEPAGDDSSSFRTPDRGDKGEPNPCPVLWQCAPPGTPDYLLADPMWPSDPRLRRFVFVTMSRQLPLGKERIYEPYKLWWLEISERADAILAAGPLTRAGADGSQIDGTIERYPNVAVDRRGQAHLIYLTRQPPARLWQLRSVALEIDRESGHPRISPASPQNSVLNESIALAPVMVSADGRKVYASAADGQIVNFAISR
jgi:hypothetical protein